MKFNNIDIDIIVRYLNGDCSLDEEEKLNSWLEEDPINEDILLFIRKIWDTSTERNKFDDVNAAWARFNQEFDLDSSRKKNSEERKEAQPINRGLKRTLSWAGWGTLAAVILLAISYSMQMMTPNVPGEDALLSQDIEFREIKTEKGQRMKLRLSDGSAVQLNANSRLSVPDRFSENEPRQIFLEGEAYFDILHDSDRPFIINVDKAVAKVLGTKFSIQSYPSEPQVTLAVAEGKVSLANSNETSVPAEIISQNQVATMESNGIPEVVSVNDMSEFIGWTTGELVFKQAAFKTVKRKLERWYDIEIHTELGSGVKIDNKLTATFSDTQRIDDVLESISLVMDVDIEKTDSASNRFTVLK